MKRKVDSNKRTNVGPSVDKANEYRIKPAPAKKPASNMATNHSEVAPRKKKPLSGGTKRLTVRVVATVLGVLIVLVGGAGLYYKSRLNLIKKPDEIFQGEPKVSIEELYEGVTGEPDPSAEQIEEELQRELDELLQNYEPIETDPDNKGGTEQTKKSNIPLNSKAGVKNYLIIGVDSRANNFRGRADSITIFSINSNTRKINLLSIFRGMAVQIPGRGIDSLNHSYAYGGPRLLKNTIEHNFRFKIDGYVVFNFNAFKKFINALGGVNVYLTGKEARIVGVSRAGNHLLNGSQALKYARIRRIDSDFQRSSRQRKVINAALRKLGNSGIAKINSVANATLPNIGTNIGHGEITNILSKAGTYLSYGRREFMIPTAGNRRRYFNKRGHEMWAFSVLNTAKQVSNFLFN
ncbi:MAG TPA: LCP family protein [Clostridiaceae bacterium]|nr:LCP family protein [Clostridiaceae bacterium]